MRQLIDKLKSEHVLSGDEWIDVINNRGELTEYVSKLAQKTAVERFSNKIFIRGLVEISNYCKNGCYYCGINCGNKNAVRYRLDKDLILSACKLGYELGFRTFVLQGGEDEKITTPMLSDIVSSIKEKYSDAAVTLSVGEKSFEEYKALYDAGADRYLLRHETATAEHYNKLHPKNLSLENRMECLYNLKKIGYQVGTGFMVGSPYQTVENLSADLCFIQEFKPHMVGIGPFVCHHDTKFRDFPNGSVDLCVYLLGLIRLMLPNCLLPATTALGTLDEFGREKGVMYGANVVMPNLSPENVRSKYLLYDNKLSTGAESAEHLVLLNDKFKKIGYEISYSRGDWTERK